MPRPPADRRQLTYGVLGLLATTQLQLYNVRDALRLTLFYSSERILRFVFPRPSIFVARLLRIQLILFVLKLQVERKKVDIV